MPGKPFQKGQSGNPGGRPRVIGELRDLARQHALEAIEELARLALKAKNESARIAAIKELLDRGYGRPLQSIEATGKEGGPIEHREVTDADRALRGPPCQIHVVKQGTRPIVLRTNRSHSVFRTNSV
jgi:hypothetical protein